MRYVREPEVCLVLFPNFFLTFSDFSRCLHCAQNECMLKSFLGVFSVAGNCCTKWKISASAYLFMGKEGEWSAFLLWILHLACLANGFTFSSVILRKCFTSAVNSWYYREWLSLYVSLNTRTTNFLLALLWSPLRPLLKLHILWVII